MSPSFKKDERHLPLALDLDQQHMLTSLAAGKNNEPQANTGYQILSDMEEAWKTTSPKSELSTTRMQMRIFWQKVKTVMFGGNLLIQPEKSSLEKNN